MEDIAHVRCLYSHLWISQSYSRICNRSRVLLFPDFLAFLLLSKCQQLRVGSETLITGKGSMPLIFQNEHNIILPGEMNNRKAESPLLLKNKLTRTLHIYQPCRHASGCRHLIYLALLQFYFIHISLTTGPYINKFSWRKLKVCRLSGVLNIGSKWHTE